MAHRKASLHVTASAAILTQVDPLHGALSALPCAPTPRRHASLSDRRDSRPLAVSAGSPEPATVQVTPLKCPSSTITHMDAPFPVEAAKDRAPSPELDVFEANGA